MERYDLIFLVIIAGFIIWQAALMIRAYREIKLVASAPGRAGGVVLCAGILALAIWRRGNLAGSWPVYVGLAVMMAMYLSARVGLSETGLFSTSRFIPYDTLEYYAIDMPEAPKCRLRLARSAGRETVMMITQEQKAQAEAWLIKAGVDNFESYGERVRARRK